MRIKENRQMSVNFDVQTPGAARIEVNMLKNDFIFGAMVDNMMKTEMDRMEDFFEIFNYGVLRNEMKWYHQENQPGNFNYDDSDSFMNWFDEHNVTLRGHAVFWSVDQFVQEKGSKNTFYSDAIGLAVARPYGFEIVLMRNSISRSGA